MPSHNDTLNRTNNNLERSNLTIRTVDAKSKSMYIYICIYILLFYYNFNAGCRFNGISFLSHLVSSAALM